MDLAELLEDLNGKAAEALKTVPDVVEIKDPGLDEIPSQGSNRWLKIPSVVAVMFDLKDSTHLGTGRHDTSTARIYKTAVESAVAVLNEFEANFIDIQGDGGFGLFWGDLAFERALCAAITVRTFSDDLVAQYETKWDDGKLPATGFKIGISCGRVLVKQLGTPRNVDEQEAVWAGKPVNYAAKAAQSADRHEIVVTGSIWDHFQDNDYVAYSCGCGGAPSSTLWSDFTIDRLNDEYERYGRIVTVPWCASCGPSFCAAIRSGGKKRDDIPDHVRTHLAKTQMASALASKAQESRERKRLLASLRR